ncbi:MAG: DUF2779 domain-containing protein [Steroidobacteraceae bacterium]
MAWLTKSRFLSGLQCAKRLWMEVHAPLEERAADTLPLANGRALDRLVQTLAPGPVIARDAGMPAAIAATTRLLRTGAPPVVYQPAFRAGELAVVADILRHHRGSRTLVEVKSGTSVKPEYLGDVAFQALVLRQARVAADRVMVAHIDPRFRLERAGDYDGLVFEQDVTGEVEEALPGIADAAAGHIGIMAAAARPRVAMGGHCRVPYECPFTERCRAEIGPVPDYPVTLLPRGGRRAGQLAAEGYEDLMQVPAERLDSALHRRVHAATLSGEPYFDARATAALRRLEPPLAYLDFETIGLAVPELLGTAPYEHVPFQFSVHVEEADGTLRHHEFLAIDTFGDLDALAAALLAALPASGPVFAYNAPFERGVLERLASRLPARANALREAAARLFDLLPVTRAAWYHRDMKGSWSIKAVLPTIAPDLDYGQLGAVREGEGAQLAFLRLRELAPDSAERVRLERDLKVYCERDTYGLVVLRRFLCGGGGAGAGTGADGGR